MDVSLWYAHNETLLKIKGIISLYGYTEHKIQIVNNNIINSKYIRTDPAVSNIQNENGEESNTVNKSITIKKIIMIE